MASWTSVRMRTLGMASSAKRRAGIARAAEPGERFSAMMAARPWPTWWACARMAAQKDGEYRVRSDNHADRSGGGGLVLRDRAGDPGLSLDLDRQPARLPARLPRRAVLGAAVRGGLRVLDLLSARPAAADPAGGDAGRRALGATAIIGTGCAGQAGQPRHRRHPARGGAAEVGLHPGGGDVFSRQRAQAGAARSFL